MSERTLYVDVLGGAAGDMLLAALIDAGAPEQQIFELVERVIPTRFRVRTVEVTRAGIRSRALHIEASSEPWRTPRLPRMLDMLDGAGLPEPIRARARAVLERLGEAEARVHGVPIEEVHLHELGDPDTILDVVGVAAALDLLSIGRMAVSSIPLGEPGPAMLELLRGFRVRSAEVSGETVTPTAAAILSALGEPAELPDFELESIGYGAGSRDPAGVPNVVRVLIGSKPAARAATGLLERDLVLLEANIDDLTPELVADAVQAVFGAGALDAWTMPIVMKKGRLGVLLSALCEPAAESRVLTVFFEATTTFGVRIRPVRRAELARRVATVTLADGAVRVKVGLLGDRVMSATPEHDDVAGLAERSGRSVRDVYEEAAAAARALRFEPADR